MLQRRSSRRDHQGSHQGSQGDSGSGNTSLDSLHDDILAEVLTQLAIGSDAEVPFSDEWLRHFPTVCLVAHRFHRAAQLDAVWQPVCSRRWKLQTDEEKWLAAAVRAAAQAAAQRAAVCRSAHRLVFAIYIEYCDFVLRKPFPYVLEHIREPAVVTEGAVYPHTATPSE